MTHWTETDIPNLTGKTAVVTGANSGLGYHTARALAAAGAQVIMACRSESKATQAMDALRGEVDDASIEFAPLDLASLESVRTFASGLENRPIDLLINNAGVMAVPYSKTADGFEMQFGTNHLGHFALTGLLLDQIRDGGRIVSLASMAHRWTPAINFDDLAWEQRRYKRWQAYGDSKLANLTFMFELSRRMIAARRNIIVAGAHPGYASTNLQFVAAAQRKSMIERLVMTIGNAVIGQPAKMGALPSLYAATASHVTSGDYIGPDGLQQMRGHPEKVGCRKQARDSVIGERLWSVSEQLTDVRYLSD
ncbi:oxidoreductase [Abyssibacter sp.]|uniref:oxidoreductase n=1 Tax=Abyssibacter sp. TaxID=2320200 RepID=UPI0025BEBB21|nr:oxidoreductase [Abyssibacter sp.]MCK5857954.1 SDR family oxidoreductase [Abyssibacter sp.]